MWKVERQKKGRFYLYILFMNSNIVFWITIQYQCQCQFFYHAADGWAQHCPSPAWSLQRNRIKRTWRKTTKICSKVPCKHSEYFKWRETSIYLILSFVRKNFKNKNTQHVWKRGQLYYREFFKNKKNAKYILPEERVREGRDERY